MPDQARIVEIAIDDFSKNKPLPKVGFKPIFFWGGG